MSKKKFAMINTSLLESRRFRSLDASSQRNVYFTALLSSRSNYIGLFHYPAWLLAQEAMETLSDVEYALKRLCDVDLIDYDLDEQFLRQKEWFYSSNIRMSETTVKRAAADFLDRQMPRTDFIGRGIAEFVVAALLDVQAYNSESTHGPVVVEQLRKFLVAATPHYPNLEKLIVQEIRLNGTAVQRCFEDLFLGIIEGECNAERLASGMVPRPPSGPQSGTMWHVTKPIPDSNKTEKKSILDVDEDEPQLARSPLPETVASKIAQSAIERRTGSR